VSGAFATWSFSTTMTLSVTSRDSARACAAVKAAWLFGACCPRVVCAWAVAVSPRSKTGTLVIATLRSKRGCRISLFSLLSGK
jgi:hypothetical protein